MKAEMGNDTPIIELRDVRLPNGGKKTEREIALNLVHIRITHGEVVFVLGKRGAGKSPLHDVLQAVFHAKDTEGQDLVLPQSDVKKPDIMLGEFRRKPEVRLHSQSGKPEDVPHAEEKVLIYCDDPIMRDPATNEDYSSAPAILDRVLERKLTMLIGTDPDRLQVALSHFLIGGMGSILWLCEGEIVFSGSIAEFLKERAALFDRFYPSDNELNEELGKFRSAVLQDDKSQPTK